MKEKQKHVPSAENAPSETAQASPQVPSAPVVPMEAPKSSAELFNEIVAGVNPKDLEKAEALGFPIKKLVLLMGTMATEIQQIAVTIPNVIKDKMNEAIKEAQERQRTQIQATPEGVAPQSGGGMIGQVGEVMGLIREAIKEGGGSDDFGLSGILKESIVAGIKEDLAFSRVVKRKFMEKLGVEVVDEATKSTETVK